MNLLFRRKLMQWKCYRMECIDSLHGIIAIEFFILLISSIIINYNFHYDCY